MNMMKVLLGNLVNIKTGKLDANQADVNGKYPFFTCSKEISKINSYSYDCECVLIAGNGDLNVKYYNGKFEAYQRTYILTSIDNNTLSNKYLYWFMNRYIVQLRNQSIGGVIKYIKLGDLTNISLNLPPLDIQKRIVRIFESIERLIDKKLFILQFLNDLSKSRFVEMFGVFNINPNNYNTIKFRDLIEQNNINEEDLVWLLNLDMIKPNTGEIVEKVYINRQNIPTSGISFKKGTVLYSKLRPYLNKVVIADENGYGTSELIPLNSYKNGLTAEYLAYYLRQDSFVEYIKDKVTGAKMPRVAMDVLRNIDIIQPNYIYQEQFSGFVNHVNKLKSDVQKSIDETQLLMDSLMQEYFG